MHIHLNSYAQSDIQPILKVLYFISFSQISALNLIIRFLRSIFFILMLYLTFPVLVSCTKSVLVIMYFTTLMKVFNRIRSLMVFSFCSLSHSICFIIFICIYSPSCLRDFFQVYYYPLSTSFCLGDTPLFLSSPKHNCLASFALALYSGCSLIHFL